LSAPHPPPPTLAPLFSTPLPPPPTSTLFPYTTLFRSSALRQSSLCCDSKTAALNHSATSPQDSFAVNRNLLLKTEPKVSVDCKADRKSTRLNSSHVSISYAVFCLKKKKKHNTICITKY